MSLAPSTLDPHTLAAYSHRMAPPTYSRGTTNPSRWVPPSMFTAPHRTVPDLHRPSDDPHGIFQDHYRPTSTPHSVAEPPTDAHLTARCVPELNGQGSEFIIADADTGGIACLPHGYLATPDHTHHPAPDDMNYFVQKSEYNRQEEFSQSCLLQSQDLKSSDRKFQTRASLYGMYLHRTLHRVTSPLTGPPKPLYLRACIPVPSFDLQWSQVFLFHCTLEKVLHARQPQNKSDSQS